MLRKCAEYATDDCDGNAYGCVSVMRQAADAIETLQDKVDMAIGFWDSKKTAEIMKQLNKYLPDTTDPEWQREHKAMGFYSPIADLYEELGII